MIPSIQTKRIELPQTKHRLFGNKCRNKTVKAQRVRTNSKTINGNCKNIRTTLLSNHDNQQGTSHEIPTTESELQSEEILSSNFNDSIDLPSINFGKYMGATSVRFKWDGQDM